jgi:hypothetical protein
MASAALADLTIVSARLPASDPALKGSDAALAHGLEWLSSNFSAKANRPDATLVRGRVLWTLQCRPGVLPQCEVYRRRAVFVAPRFQSASEIFFPACCKRNTAVLINCFACNHIIGGRQSWEHAFLLSRQTSQPFALPHRSHTSAICVTLPSSLSVIGFSPVIADNAQNQSACDDFKS